ncbi:MAG: carbohydrate-binding family 9-like protein, partial [Myxococcota bacterium]|nr:carbohydrate-binding family 9-like protein [Myxococcota bacterium]
MRCVSFVVGVAVLLVVAGCGAGCGDGCVDQGPGPEPKVAPGYEREHLLTEVPAGVDRFDVQLADAVIYLGNKVDKPRLAPGQTVTITHYWKVVRPPGKQWRPFALVRGPAGTADFMNLEPTDMQRVHPTAEWKAGEIIEDVQTFTMRPDWRSPSATVLVGLIEVGRHGTLDRMAVQGERTADRAIVAAQLDIDLSRAPPPPGSVHIPRAQGAIVIDGVGTDPGWANATTSPDFTTAEGSPEPVGKATAKLVWDDHYLYVFATITDTDVFSPYKQQDDPLWKADCIEIFIDADGNRRGYVELQVNPNNATFDSWFAGPRGPAGDEAWDSGMLSAVTMRGTPDVAGDADQGWDVELAIPWAAVKGNDPAMAIGTPPRIGERWKLNVVRVDKRSGSEAPSASSWNRITYRDFHALDRMLSAVFADATG